MKASSRKYIENLTKAFEAIDRKEAEAEEICRNRAALQDQIRELESRFYSLTGRCLW